MPPLKFIRATCLMAFLLFAAPSAGAQTATNLAALQGLAPVSALQNTEAGKAALAANLAITGGIQAGTLRQPTLLPFPEQRQQALRDGFITFGNADGLADGLGTSLGDAYRSATSYTSADDGRTSKFTAISPTLARLFIYGVATTISDSVAGKYFFANGTLNGGTPVSAAATKILTGTQGITDVYGKAYGRPAGSVGADRYGNSRPFEIETHFVAFTGPDYFGVPSGNVAYLRGPAQDLTDSPSYPSGHTTYGYTEALLLALLVPERYPQMVARAAEYGNDRIILGAHYAMDVIGGRTLALYDLAQLLASKPGYVAVARAGVTVDDFASALAAARADLTKALEAGCGHSVDACARSDHGRFADPTRDRIFYEATQTYGLPTVLAQTATGAEDVGKLAPEAGYLLTAAFPYLSLAQADAILSATEGPGGGFLDNGSHFGVYSRLDLHRAAESAITLAPRTEQRVRQ